MGQKSGLLASPEADAAATGRGLFMAAKWLMFPLGFFSLFWLVD